MTERFVIFITLFSSYLFFASNTMASSSTPNQPNDQLSHEVTSSVIAIDIGHSVKKVGATSARGVGEFFFNQRIAKKLKKALQAEGFEQAFLINPEGKPIKLKERTALAAEKNAAVFVSIHHDSMQMQFLQEWQYEGKTLLYSERFQGYSLFISPQNKYAAANRQLADELGMEFLRAGFIPTLHHAMPIKGENRTLLDKDKGIYAFPELAVLRTATMPAILVECGIILNRDEELKLNDPAYQNRIVQVLVQGIKQFLINRTSNTNTAKDQKERQS
ncbi:MAG: N-acetylmuramoyl-L-alanine amidase family protein [bacterium]